jgi:tetratricopeptide (TPR) repeat protein
VESDPRSPVAHTARALALIRGGNRLEAEAALRAALQLGPGYAQALAWQSFLFRTAERLDEALTAARRAVREAPHSSLASQSLSDALFAWNLTREAQKEAQRAVSLNPLSPGAHVSLGRTLLQEGRLDQAAPEAFRAVALDPSLDRAHFFLGLVLWEQRRLARAVAEFARARDLDPGYLEARAYLARAYLAQGRRQQALAEAQAARAQALPPGAVEDERMAPVHAALGRVYYGAGQFRQAAAEYRTAVALARAPAPAYELELARVYLEQNDLPDALDLGLRAVSHAPRSHEAHALLGLIYDRRSNAEQALREYREALSLFSDDALARLGLGTSTPAGGERVREIRRVVKNQPDVSFAAADTGDSLREVAQAMLRIPSVLADIFKPGVTTEVAPVAGSQSAYGLGLTHRDQYLRGDLHDLSFANREGDENYRNDRSEKRTFGWTNLAGAPDYRTHVLGQYLFTSRDVALPGALASPTPNARSAFSENSWDLAARHEWGAATSAWLHASYRFSHATDQDPDTLQDRFALLRSPTLLSRTERSQLGAELRLDHHWGGGHTTTYVLFAGRSRLDNPQIGYTRATRQLDDIQRIFVRDQLVTHTFQHDYRPGGRLSLIMGATAERFTGAFRTEKPGEIVLRSPDTVETRWRPYAQATYVLTRQDLIRLIGHRRGQRGFDPLLQPAEAFLVDEFPTLETGSETTNYELDLEHRFSPRIFAKLFFFTGRLNDLIVVPSVTQTMNPFLFPGPNGLQAYSAGFVVPKARIQGVGVRYEHQVGRFLSSSLRLTYREFTDQTPQAAPSDPAPGRQIPLSPRQSAVLSLNYIDRAGTKLFLEADWSGGQYQGVDRLTRWQRLPSTTVVNFRWAKERTVRGEWALGVNNLFNAGTIYWPGFPAPGRVYRLQYAFRF